MPVLTLKDPFELNGKRYEALTFRKARGAEMRALDRSGLMALLVGLRDAVKIVDGNAEVEIWPTGMLDKASPIMAMLADVDEAVIDRLDAKDYLAAFEKMQEVIGDGPLSPQVSTTA